MVTVAQRIEAIKSDSKYQGMEVYAKKIKDAVVVNITFYLSTYGVNAVKQVEEWVVYGATEKDYLDKSAKKITYNVGRTINPVTFFGKIKRWLR